MSSMTRITRVLTLATGLVLIALTLPAGATSRPYLDLPATQLPDVAAFHIGATTISIDVTVPADVPAGNVWTFFHTAFAAGDFDRQYTDQPKIAEALHAGQHYTLTLPVPTDEPCTQVDLGLVGPLNPTEQPYAADLTANEVCRPGYTPPAQQATTSTTAAPTTSTTAVEQQATTTTTAPAEQATTSTTAPAEAITDATTSAPTAMASSTTLPVTGGHADGLLTAALSLIAVGVTLCTLARARRHGVA